MVNYGDLLLTFLGTVDEESDMDIHSCLKVKRFRYENSRHLEQNLCPLIAKLFNRSED